MVPATMTIDAIFTQAASAVTPFGGLVLIVVGIGLGIWGVKFLISTVRKARR